MLDIQLIRKNPDFVREKLAIRGVDVDFTDFLKKDKERRELIYATEKLKAERNKSSAEIPELKKEGKDISEILERMREVGDQIKINDLRLADLNQEQKSFIADLPNLPADGVWAGNQSFFFHHRYE